MTTNPGDKLIREKDYEESLVALHEAIVDSPLAGSTDPLGSQTTRTDQSYGNSESNATDIESCLRMLETLRRAGLPSADSASATLPHHIGRFQIQRVLGHGSFGIVYQAIDPSLNRNVAVKVPAPHACLSPMLRERFLREANVTAALDHPNILRVYEAGHADGFHYLVSAFCDGPTLGQWLSDYLSTQESTHSPFSEDAQVPEKDAARLVATIADAVHHAHSRGVLHRDLKPNNILLDTRQSDPEADSSDMPDKHACYPSSQLATVARVSDFGLAKLSDDDSHSTRSGAIVGTPAYMAPEQASGDGTAVGSPADIYALGAILYELLTGRSPHQHASVAATLHSLRTSSPASPRQLRPELSLDLDAICLKCLERDPGDRYHSAGELSEDLERYLSGEPIAARRLRTSQQLARWARRNPIVSGLTAVVIVLFLLLSTGSTIAAIALLQLNRTALDGLQAEIVAKDAATMNEELAIRALYEARLAQAKASRNSGMPGQRLESLAAIREASKHIERLQMNKSELLRMRNEVIAALAHIDLRLDRRWPGLPPRLEEHVALDIGIERFARLEADGQIAIRSMQDNRRLVSLPGLGSFDEVDGRPQLSFSPDGRYLAMRGQNAATEMRLQIWSLEATADLLLDMASEGDEASNCFAFSADSSRLAFAGSHGELGIVSLPDLDTATIKLGWTPRWFCFSPLGKQLAMDGGSKQRPVVLVTIETRELKVIQSFPKIRSRDGDWSRDGKMLAVAAGDMNVYVADMLDHSILSVCKGHTDYIRSVSFANRHDLLASTGLDMTTRLWSPRTGTQLLRVNQAGRDFSQADRWLGLVDSGVAVGRWEVAAGDEYSLLRGTRNGSFVYDMNFSPDGRILATAGQSDGVRIWDTESKQEITHLNVEANSVRFEKDGASLYVGGRASGIQRWPVEIDNDVMRIDAPKTVIVANYSKAKLSLSRDSSTGVLNRDWFTAQVVDLPGGSSSRTIQAGDIRFHAVSPDNRWVATGSWRGIGVKIWDASHGELIQELPVRGGARVAFSPDGRWLVTSSAENHSFWRVPSWSLSHEIPAEGFSFGRVAFNQSGSVMAASFSNRVRLVNPSNGFEYATLMSPQPSMIRSIALSPDCRYLSAATLNGSVDFWDLAAMNSQLKPMRLGWDPELAVSAPTSHKPLNVKMPTWTSSSDWGSDYGAIRAFDQNQISRWNSASGAIHDQWLAVNWPIRRCVKKVTLFEAFGRIRNLRLQQQDEHGQWIDSVTASTEELRRIKGVDPLGDENDAIYEFTFSSPLPSPGFRVVIDEAIGNSVSIREITFEFCSPPISP